MTNTTGDWEEEFYELTKTLDGQIRPKLKLILTRAVEEERERIRKWVLEQERDTVIYGRPNKYFFRSFREKFINPSREEYLTQITNE